MSKKYLLYIDILGFSELVKTNPIKVDQIFTIIDELNVHEHNAFKTIIFSDTILVYNIYDPKDERDHEYDVMFLCEFVQDLLYRTITKDIYFKAILLYDEFKDYNLKNAECYYGKSLIDAYNKEKDIISMGLYIHNDCNKYNLIFPTMKYDNDYSFVYLNQNLETLLKNHNCKLPINDFILSETEDFSRIIWDITLLKNVYNLMNSHPSVKVRAKYLMYWQFYRTRYKDFVDELEKNDFDLHILNKNYNWDKKIKLMTNE